MPITVALRPSPGACSTIIVSVFRLPPSRVVPSSVSSASVAVERSSFPTMRMFWSLPSMSVRFAGLPGPARIAVTRGMWLVKSCQVIHAQPLTTSRLTDSSATTARPATRSTARGRGSVMHGSEDELGVRGGAGGVEVDAVVPEPAGVGGGDAVPVEESDVAEAASGGHEGVIVRGFPVPGHLVGKQDHPGAISQQGESAGELGGVDDAVGAGVVHNDGGERGGGVLGGDVVQ